VHVRLHLAPERAVARVFAVEVLDHHDAGPRLGRDIVEILEPPLHVGGVSRRDRVLGLDGDGLGEADHRRKIRERAMQVFDRGAGPAPLRRDDLDQIAHGGRIDRSQELQLFQLGGTAHSRDPP
jgi:hypothetical protein